MYAVCNKLDLSPFLQHPEIKVNIQDVAGNTALNLAIFKNHLPIIRQLLSFPGTDMSLKNKWGYTAADVAKKTDRPEVLALFRCEILALMSAEKAILPTEMMFLLNTFLYM